MKDFSLPFSAWVGPREAQIVLVGEAWGREEASCEEPFVGASGKELWRMLGEAWPQVDPQEHARVQALHLFGNSWINARKEWLASAGVAFTNVFNLRPKDNKIQDLCTTAQDPRAWREFPQLHNDSGPRFLREEFAPQVRRLQAELAAARPNLVVAMGARAAWALLKTIAIGSIRGAVTQSAFGALKVLPTFHPASVLYQWSQRPILVADLMKALREGQFPEIRRPQRFVKVSPTLEEWASWCQGVLDDPPPLLGCDTETSLGMIDTLGFARSSQDAIVCQVGPHRVARGTRFWTVWPQRDGKDVTAYWTPQEEVIFWSWARRLLESPTLGKCFQNGVYDLQYLIRMGLRPQRVIEDSMLRHHALFPELRKGLGFLGSIYTSEPAWKLMRRGGGDSEKRDE